MKWDDRMKQLKDCKAEQGHLRIPLSDPVCG
jgi:hypothetical protein